MRPAPPLFAELTVGLGLVLSSHAQVTTPNVPSRTWFGHSTVELIRRTQPDFIQTNAAAAPSPSPAASEPAPPAEFGAASHMGAGIDLASLPPITQKRIAYFLEHFPEPAPDRFETGFLHVLKNAYPAPAVIKLGKFGIGGGIGTAIKRKNPLALISPVPLEIWF